MIDFIRNLIPTSVQVEWGTAGAVFGSIFTFLFGWNSALETLLIAMGIDYVTGVIAAYLNPEMKLNSTKGFRGLLKKIMELCLIALAYRLSLYLNMEILYTGITCAYLANEGLSIVENAAKAGVPIPKKLRDTLEQLKIEKE